MDITGWWGLHFSHIKRWAQLLTIWREWIHMLGTYTGDITSRKLIYKLKISKWTARFIHRLHHTLQLSTTAPWSRILHCCDRPSDRVWDLMPLLGAIKADGAISREPGKEVQIGNAKCGLYWIPSRLCLILGGSIVQTEPAASDFSRTLGSLWRRKRGHLC